MHATALKDHDCKINNHSNKKGRETRKAKQKYPENFDGIGQFSFCSFAGGKKINANVDEPCT